MPATVKRARTALVLCLALALCGSAAFASPRDLAEVKSSGVLRHLGIAYANFITGQGDGLDVDLMRLFARHLGVHYVYVPTDWDTLFPDLTGRKHRTKGADVELLGEAPVKGDVIASGLTVLPWRQKLVDFSRPTFPTQVWLVVKAESKVTPIAPSGDIKKDIDLTRGKLRGLSLLCKSGTCLDPALFNLEPTGAKPRLFPGSLNDLAPALILKGETDATLLDVPDALVALQKYPGKIKIIGPMSDTQDMAVAFAKQSPRLREEFDRFFAALQQSGEYDRMIKRYYPFVTTYFPKYFSK
ncbi:MAG TPA: ABC transporter substrate-binding protein [Humidesulfovibrio sp.]|uniref:ABC transporter substrate-binding protein n=1 Tax=Humidesulfovibrio sp. TaxID=2910988 RepID=UPI002C160264|nr:ABC transporter substrate-binding protein [Humidesulfovibrio sp.]HWR03815.1 ABC transporter substrate-binding protein [Humidesulfovibrio sp.]